MNAPSWFDIDSIVDIHLGENGKVTNAKITGITRVKSNKGFRTKVNVSVPVVLNWEDGSQWENNGKFYTRLTGVDSAFLSLPGAALQVEDIDRMEEF